jgi:hypothetical protein
MAGERDTVRMVEELARSLGVPWTDEERAQAIAEGQALVPLLDLMWQFPLADPVGGWRQVEP